MVRHEPELHIEPEAEPLALPSVTERGQVN